MKVKGSLKVSKEQIAALQKALANGDKSFDFGASAEITAMRATEKNFVAAPAMMGCVAQKKD